jgi:general secretion pathway protein N
MRTIMLAGLLAVAGLTPSFGQLTQTQTAPPPPAEKRTSVLPWLSLDALKATRDRPLFTVDRRPLPPPVAAAPPVKAGPPPKVVPTLRGIIVRPPEVLVVLQDSSTNESVVVRSGEDFGPWRVTAQTDHSVQLASGSERINLDLFED